MNSILIAISLFCLYIKGHAADSDALRECSNIHHLELHNLPNAHGEYSNSNCALKCQIGEQVLSQEAVNEGFSCDATGVCRSGQCIGTSNGATEAARECGNLHHIDFHQANSTGTVFSESGCSIKCVLNGNTISTNNLNDGFSCPQNGNGICHNGHCLVNGHEVTSPPPVTTQNPSKFNASDYKVNQIDITIYSASLNQVYLALFATGCLLDTSTNRCKAQCATSRQPENHATNYPTWSQRDCLLSGPFSMNDAIRVELYHEQELDSKSVGSVYEILHTFIEQRLEKKTADDQHGTMGFHFREQFALHKNSTLTGTMDLEFSIKISRK